MIEIVKSYIGEQCFIYTMNSQVKGVIKKVSEGWISVDNGKNIEAINLDYIVRIRPVNKSKNKKSFDMD